MDDDTKARRFDWTAPLVMRRCEAGGGERRRLHDAPPRRTGDLFESPDNVALPLCAPNVGWGVSWAVGAARNDGTAYLKLPATSLPGLPQRGGDLVASGS